MDSYLIAYYVGIAIVILTHVYMLLQESSMNRDAIVQHAAINLVAAALIAYYFMHKQYGMF